MTCYLILSGNFTFVSCVPVSFATLSRFADSIWIAVLMSAQITHIPLKLFCLVSSGPLSSATLCISGLVTGQLSLLNCNFLATQIIYIPCYTYVFRDPYTIHTDNSYLFLHHTTYRYINCEYIGLDYFLR